MGSTGTKMKKLFATVCLIIVFNANLSKADESSCRTVLQKCDQALQSERDLNSLQKQIIFDQDKRSELQTNEINKLKFDNTAFYRQPWFWFIVGSVTGGYVVSQVRK